MKVTISEYQTLFEDVSGNDLPLAGKAVASQKLTAAGNATALADETRFVRIATDAAIHIKQGTGAADTDPMMPANTVEYFSAREGIVYSIIAA
jgi:hypothetical protein